MHYSFRRFSSTVSILFRSSCVAYFLIVLKIRFSSSLVKVSAFLSCYLRETCIKYAISSF